MKKWVEKGKSIIRYEELMKNKNLTSEEVFNILLNEWKYSRDRELRRNRRMIKIKNIYEM